MSLHTLPCLYLNLGVEMLYILDQRLEDQGISADRERKGKKLSGHYNAICLPTSLISYNFSLVMKDIVKNFLSEQVLSSLFTPQPMATKKRLKTNFNKLAHSSIMKLTSDAMEKVRSHDHLQK